MDVYALKWKGSRYDSNDHRGIPIGGRAPSGASGSRADGSKVESLPKNSNPRVHSKANCVNRKRANSGDISTNRPEITRVAREPKKTYKQKEVIIGTLNIHGKKYANGQYKYKDLTTLIRKNRIAVLAIQECRLDDEEANKVEMMCPKIKIIHNSNKTSKEGIAFIINKDLVKDRDVEHKNLIQNRMSRITISSPINWCIQKISLAASTAAMYSATVVDKATMV